MTKKEKIQLSKAIRLLQEDGGWDDGMTILCKLINPEWEPPKIEGSIPWTEAFRMVFGAGS